MNEQIRAEFQKEERYIVVKIKTLRPEQLQCLRQYLVNQGIGTVECVVVEHDWPNYEHVWQTVEQVANGTWSAAHARYAGSGLEPLLAKHQPCGCVICTCENDEQCQGCGAKNCGSHPIGKIPNPVYTQPVGYAGSVSPEMQNIAAQLYQCAGAYDMPATVMDVLSALQRGNMPRVVELLPCAPPAQPQVPEGHNIKSAELYGDQSVIVQFPSCRSANAFRLWLTQAIKEASDV